MDVFPSMVFAYSTSGADTFSAMTELARNSAEDSSGR